MTDKIIALVDGSAYSRSVCDHAAWIAERGGCAVELMHVLGRREGGAGSDLSGAISLGARTALLEELSSLDEQRAKLSRARGRAILEDAKALLEREGVQASEHLRRGDLIEAVTDKEREAELILIGKRGEAADFAKGHLGSNTERVVRAASKPLFITSRAFRPITKVLVAFDGSANAMRAVDYAARSTFYAGLVVKIVTVGPATDAALKALEDAKAVLSPAMKTDTAILSGQPEEALAGLIETDGFDHLIMGAAGHSRLRSLFVGSTSLEMIRTCKVPVLLVR
ncbi:universal stress protein [Paracoccus sp. TK19116]|uniref:Universal stress protein n=1 Tax=Paracoccus albicereus TaxID=2922394 RepID=A0ABT1MUN7_9RHOB|nr:universal stress protein [Paracoccus albicereus]MCQ0972002.1 universal stress protein [Paracoccus albicereus]